MWRKKGGSERKAESGEKGENGGEELSPDLSTLWKNKEDVFDKGLKNRKACDIMEP